MKWLSIALIPLFLIGCGGTATTQPEQQAAKPATEAKPAAQQTASADASALPFPATETKKFKVIRSVGDDVMNGIGWETDSAQGTTFNFKGDELSVETPNSFAGGKLLALTFKILSYNPETGIMLTKVSGTQAFGEGNLNGFWSSLPYANVHLVKAEDGRSIKVKFGAPAENKSQVDTPKVADSAAVFQIR